MMLAFSWMNSNCSECHSPSTHHSKVAHSRGKRYYHDHDATIPTCPHTINNKAMMISIDSSSKKLEITEEIVFEITKEISFASITLFWSKDDATVACSRPATTSHQSYQHVCIRIHPLSTVVFSQQWQTRITYDGQRDVIKTCRYTCDRQWW